MKTSRILIIAMFVFCRLSSSAQHTTALQIPATSNDSLFIAIQTLPDTSKQKLIKSLRYCVMVVPKTNWNDDRTFCDTTLRDFTFYDSTGAFDSVYILREIRITFNDSVKYYLNRLSSAEKGLFSELIHRDATIGTKGIGSAGSDQVIESFEEDDDHKFTITSAPKDGAQLYLIPITAWDRDPELSYLDESHLTSQIIEKIVHNGYARIQTSTTLQTFLPGDYVCVVIAVLDNKYKMFKPWSALRNPTYNFKFK
jgi:hypothetical protein